DIFGDGISPADSDSDGIPDFLDLDSDNDGIYDAVESGSGAPHTSGVLVGNIFGANGLADILETSANSGVLNYTIRDTDGDGSYNAVDHDSDADLCNDVREAGYNDGNNNGYLGNSATPTVNSNGVVTGAGGYTVPNANYLIPV